MKQSRFTFQEVTMTNNILLTLIALSFIGFLASCLATAKTFPIPSVTVDTELIEIEFVPTHSLYQKRCLVDGELVYCVSADVLSTVSIDHNEVEIDFIADAQ